MYLYADMEINSLKGMTYMNDKNILEKENSDSVGEVQIDKPIANLYEWIEAAVFSLLCVALIFTFLFRIVGVDGDSMNNTLYDEERLIITRLFYTPHHGDIVIINRYTQEPLVKRIIALEGDTLEINPETNEVIVNGEILDEPYALGITEPIEYQNEYKNEPIPKGYMFVMGDNRENSKDSRKISEIGFVKENDIMGKAVYRFFPISRAGGLY